VSGRKAHSAVCRTWASGPSGYETPSEARDCYNVALPCAALQLPAQRTDLAAPVVSCATLTLPVSGTAPAAARAYGSGLRFGRPPYRIHYTAVSHTKGRPPPYAPSLQPLAAAVACFPTAPLPLQPTEPIKITGPRGEGCYGRYRARSG
jgi:hypothetical protein